MSQAWPNGGGAELLPEDYYHVHFVAAHEDVPAGSLGIVVDHVVAPGGEKGCVVEVAPFDHDGAPVSVVTVDPGKLALEED